MKLSFKERTTRREVTAITAVAALVLTQLLGTLTQITHEFSPIRFLESLENSTGDEPAVFSSPQETANSYRQKADRLLQQNRIGEAPEVLDWLKLREVEAYLSAQRGNPQPDATVAPPSPAQPIEDSLSPGNEIQLGKELTALLAIPEAQRTAQERQRIAQLIELQGQIRQRFNHFIRTHAVKAMQRHLNDTTREQNLRLTNLNNLRDNLQSDDVLLYPLILPDRLELVLVTPDSPPVRRTVPVKPEELQQAIVAFRQALSNPFANAKVPAQKLYNWLIRPIEGDLMQAQAKTILYAPDAQLRYIPLAALHDGKQWLVQRFGIYNITSAALDDLDSQRQQQLRVLAGAFSQGQYSFRVGSRQFELAGLPFAGVEVENLALTVPQTTKLIDEAFNPEAFVPKMQDYNVVHLATHAAFVPGKPEDSFILFGNGDRVTLRDVESWNLPGVDLVVLSACETGVGGEFGTGEEILGFGYLMQQAGAKAVMASLWSVDDGGTQVLMNVFYRGLQGRTLTKAEALRQAQLALIAGDDKVLGEQRGIAVVQPREGVSRGVENRLSHPYYWAPFILIGNGL